MKRFLLLGLFALAACGGGGGGNPTPAATQTPIANTSSVYYFPMASGNSWTFSSGGKMTDLGPITLSCSCLDNGASIERIGLYSPGSSSISSSFFFTKYTPAGRTQLTNIIGVENDAGVSNIQVISNTAFPYGLPIMDDSPAANESWNDGVGDTSTITSVGGTMMLPNGSEVINIATDQITGSFSTITWAFAKGVGFTSIGVGSQVTTLTSFSVNAGTSTASTLRQQSAPIGIGHPGAFDMTALSRIAQ